MRGVRPTDPLWTAHQLEQIQGLVTAGVPIPKASEAAGVRWTTARHWLRKGRKGTAPYADFADAMRRAKAIHEVACSLSVMGAANKGDWRAAAYMLERIDSRRRLSRSGGRLPCQTATVVLYPVPMPEGADPGL